MIKFFKKPTSRWTDIVLVRSDLCSVADSIALSRATIRNIKQSLFWALIYIVIGIPIAALGFLSPVVACTARHGHGFQLCFGCNQRSTSQTLQAGAVERINK